ncbi:MAG: hypothetical protein II152_03815 [Succinivibrionaceae bacterium]|nr:hypothetical protein [Succinivibrionaceae bacterium]
MAAFAVNVVSAGIAICRALGIFKQDTNSEELGDKAIQAYDAGIRPEDYEGRFKEYREKIENFELDPEKSKQIDVNDKLKVAGNIAGWGLTDYFGRASGIDKFIRDINNNGGFYTPERATAYLEAFKNGGMDKIGDYFNNKLDNVKDIEIVEAKLTDAEKELGCSDKEAEEHLDQEMDRRAES